MDFICEEAEPGNLIEDPYYGGQENWYEDACAEPEGPVRDTATIVNQLHCQEAQARKSDLQLACRLDELANSLRSGTPPNFKDEAYSPGQTLNEFLCVLEKRLLEKTNSQEENGEDCEPEYQMYCSPGTQKSPSPKRRAKSSTKKLNYSNATMRPVASTMRNAFELPSTMRSCYEPPSEKTCYEPPSAMKSCLEPHPTSRGCLEPQTTMRGCYEPQSIMRSRLDPQTTARSRFDPLTTARSRFDPLTTARSRLDPQSTTRSRLDPQRTTRSRLEPQSTTRGGLEQSSSPDWKAMLHDSSEIVCYPSDRLAMYGKTAGDIWKRRAERKQGACKCPSPPNTPPVRQVQAIPVRCNEESELSTTDLRRMEYCGCTVNDIIKKKAKRTTFKTPLDDEDESCWHHRQLDNSSFWKSKRKHNSRKHSPSRRKGCAGERSGRSDESPDNSDSEERLLRLTRSWREKVEDSQSQMAAGPSNMNREEWLGSNRSCSSMCCCDDLPQRVAEWTESHFGQRRNDKAVSAGIDCRMLLDQKPLLKRKPTFRMKKLRDSYKSFVSGISSCTQSSPKAPCRRQLECLECSSPEIMAFMRERSKRSCSPHRSRHKNRYPRTPHNKPGCSRKPTTMMLHLVTPPHDYYQMDDYEY